MGFFEVSTGPQGYRMIITAEASCWQVSKPERSGYPPDSSEYAGLNALACPYPDSKYRLRKRL